MFVGIFSLKCVSVYCESIPEKHLYIYMKNKNQEYKRIDISYFLTISHLDLSPFRSQITSIKGKKHVFKNTTKDSEKW